MTGSGRVASPESVSIHLNVSVNNNDPNQSVNLLKSIFRSIQSLCFMATGCSSCKHEQHQ